MIKVCEIFTSIQGESSYAGLPCTFIRLSGCNLRCNYCDTKYAYEEGGERSIEYILDEVVTAGVKLVLLTGGEPLVQKEASLLVSALLIAGYKVMVETNGSMDVGVLDPGAIIVIDVKTPGSGQGESFLLENLDYLTQEDEIKFALADKADYEWSKGFIEEHILLTGPKVLMSPVFGVLAPEELARWIVRDGLHNVRLNLQLHKYIFGAEARGV